MGQFCPDLIASPPEFPYEFVNVGIARDLYGVTVKQNAVDIAQQQAPVVEQQPSNANVIQQTQQSQQSQQQQMVQQEQPMVQQQMHQEQVQPPENVSYGIVYDQFIYCKVRNEASKICLNQSECCSFSAARMGGTSRPIKWHDLLRQCESMA